MESVYVPTFQQGGGPGFEHTAPQPAAAATPTEAGAREHRFSPYVDNGGCASSGPFLKMTCDARLAGVPRRGGGYRARGGAVG